MTTEPAKPPEPRESEELLKRALMRVKAARDTLRDDPKRLTPTPHKRN